MDRVQKVQKYIDEGMSYKQISEEIGISVSTINKMVGQGLVKGARDIGGIRKERVACDNCRAEFSREPSEIRKANNHFCSRSCSAIFTNRKRKEQNPNGYDATKTEQSEDTCKVTCDNRECGRTFFRHKDRIRKDKPTFCSQKCIGKYYATTIEDVEDMDKKDIAMVLKEFDRIGDVANVMKATKLSRKRVVKILKHYDRSWQKTRSYNNGQIVIKSKIDRKSDAFSTKAGRDYWAGFMITDGYVSKDLGTIGMCLGLEDAEHIDKFRSFVEYEGKQSDQSSEEQITCMVADRKMAYDLNEMGITPQKTFTACASDELARSISFWRGVIDGDGTVGTARKSEAYIVLYSASLKLISQYQEFLYKILEVEFRAVAHKTSTGQDLFRVTVNGFNAKCVIELLYNGAEPDNRLERKYKKAELIKKREYLRTGHQEKYLAFKKEISERVERSDLCFSLPEEGS